MGWVVWPDAYKDKKPHLFVKPTNGAQLETGKCWTPDWGKRTRIDVWPLPPFHYPIHVDWQKVEEDCGWVQVSTNRQPNYDGEKSVVANGTTGEYKVEHKYGGAYGDRWEVSYNGKLIGYFKDSFWKTKDQPKGSFTAFKNVHWYGEVSSPDKKTCTDMGSGKEVGMPGAADITDMRLTDSKGNEQGADAVQKYSTIKETDPYKVGFMGMNSFSYGGPGAQTC